MELTIKLDLSDRTHSILSVLAAAISNHTAPQMQAIPTQAEKPTLVAQTPAAPIQTPPAPIPQQTPAVQQIPVVPTAPQGTHNVAPVAGAVPTAPAPTYTLDQLGNAGAALASAGKVKEAMALLQQFGVQSIQGLDPSQYGAFATALRGLGAPI